MDTRITEPTIVTYGENMDRNDWYVYVSRKNPKSGIREKKVFKKDVNRIHNKAERIKAIKQLAAAISHKLKHEKWNPFSTEDIPEIKAISLVLDDMMNIKRSSLKPKSISTYSDVLKMFKEWLNKNNYSHLYPTNFTGLMAQSYLDYLLTEKHHTGKTHNGQMGILKTIFYMMQTRKIINDNPFKGIVELQESQASNVPYTKIEKEKITDYLKRHNIRLYYAICFVYFCFIRRSELIRLKIKHIDFENHTITIPSEISKNSKTESVTIPKEFEKILKEMNLKHHDPEEYIIGHKFQTCSRPIIRADSLTTAMKRVNDELGITGKAFYSWKHSGVCELYMAIKDPYVVMRQCRHSELKVTMIYLRSLGLTVDEGIRKADFRF